MVVQMMRHFTVKYKDKDGYTMVSQPMSPERAEQALEEIKPHYPDAWTERWPR